MGYPVHKAGWRCTVAILGIACLGFAARAAAGPTDVARTRIANEFDLKAAFLFNFTQFVEWPSGAFPGDKAPFVLGVLGENPFGNVLQDLVENEQVQGRRIALKNCRTPQEAIACQLVYVSRSEASRMTSVLELLDHRSILTVADMDGFAARGGMIGFVIAQDRLHLQINEGSVRAARLTISSKLLRQAEVFRGRE